MKKVTLFTRQQENALKILEDDGVFRIKPEWIRRKYGDISDHFIKKYDWLSYESSKRVPRPEGVSYHIWCSIDEAYRLPESPGEVIFELSIDEDKIIYFDSLKWDMILNHMYIPADPADEKAFYEELKLRGIRNPYTLIDDPEGRFHPDLVRRIRNSWQRVFDIKSWTMFSVQANIWEFRPQDVVSVYRKQLQE